MFMWFSLKVYGYQRWVIYSMLNIHSIATSLLVGDDKLSSIVNVQCTFYLANKIP